MLGLVSELARWILIVCDLGGCMRGLCVGIKWNWELMFDLQNTQGG